MTDTLTPVRLNGRFRDTADHPGKHPVDRLLDYISLRCRIPSRSAVLDALEIEHAVVSRIRKGENKIPPIWILKAYDLTGISIHVLREQAGLEPLCERIDTYPVGPT